MMNQCASIVKERLHKKLRTPLCAATLCSAAASIADEHRAQEVIADALGQSRIRGMILLSPAAITMAERKRIQSRGEAA